MLLLLLIFAILAIDVAVDVAVAEGFGFSYNKSHHTTPSFAGILVKIAKKCRHWSTSILSQVLLCSSRSILNPRIFCQTPSQIFLHFPVSHYESLWMESLYKAWFDGVDQLQMFFHTNLQLCNYIPSYFNKCHSMFLKRIGEKNCSQRFHAIYIVFEVVHFQMFSLLLDE